MQAFAHRNPSQIIAVHRDSEFGDPTDQASRQVRALLAQAGPHPGSIPDAAYHCGREAIARLANALEVECDTYTWSRAQCCAVAATFAQAKSEMDESGRCGFVVVMDFLAEQIRVTG